MTLQMWQDLTGRPFVRKATSVSKHPMNTLQGLGALHTAFLITVVLANPYTQQSSLHFRAETSKGGRKYFKFLSSVKHRLQNRAPYDYCSTFPCAEVATYLHACEGESVVKLTNQKIPYFNAPIFLENKTQIGKVEEIFGPINDAVSHPKYLLPSYLIFRRPYK